MIRDPVDYRVDVVAERSELLVQSLQVVKEVDIFFSDGDSADVAAMVEAPALMGVPSESSLIIA